MYLQIFHRHIYILFTISASGVILKILLKFRNFSFDVLFNKNILIKREWIEIAFICLAKAMNYHPIRKSQQIISRRFVKSLFWLSWEAFLFNLHLYHYDIRNRHKWSGDNFFHYVLSIPCQITCCFMLRANKKFLEN